MKLNLTTKYNRADIEIILVINKKIKSDKKILKELNFKGNDEECVLLTETKKIYVGCEDNHHDSIRIALACAIRKLNTTTYKSAKIICKDNLKAIVDGLELGNYTFDKYKSKKDSENKKEKDIYIEVSEITSKLQNEFEEAVNICEAVNSVRNMVNTTPDDFYPEIMALEASIIAKENSLECKIFDDEYLEEQGMGS
ncbi:MAG: leucyl aminopeptidase, partial [Epsilonproteobacteria bacterium]